MVTQRRRLPSYLNAQISLLCASSLLRTEPPLDDQNGGSRASETRSCVTCSRSGLAGLRVRRPAMKGR